MPLRNIALTVQELDEGAFYWVLLEAADPALEDADDALPYMVLETAAQGQASYANALVAGVAAMRRMFGPDGPKAGP